MTEEKENFVIDTESKADWALKKLGEINKQIDNVNNRADVQRKAIDDWENGELSKLEENKQYFENLLNDFMENQLEINPKYKLSSPFGRLSTRKTKKWTYDVDKLVDEYKDTDLVKTTFKLDKNALKKRIKVVDDKYIDTETGAVVDGLNIDENQQITIKAEVLD